MYTCGRDSGSCHTVTTDCNITADFICSRHYVPPVCLAALVLWLCLWHSFLPPAFFSGRSLETSWAWRQPLTLVRCILVCAFSNSVLVSCAPPPPWLSLLCGHSWKSTQLTLEPTSHTEWLTYMVADAKNYIYLLTAIWFVQYGRGWEGNTSWLWRKPLTECDSLLVADSVRRAIETDWAEQNDKTKGCWIFSSWNEQFQVLPGRAESFTVTSSADLQTTSCNPARRKNLVL